MRYLFFAALLPWSIALVSGALYPANPQLTDTAAYVSGTGVVSFERQGWSLQWSALEGLQTDGVVATAKGVVLVGTSAGLFALSANDGSVQWKLMSAARVFSPSFRDGIAYAGDEQGLLRAIDADSGTVRWRRKFPGWIYPPAISAGRLVAGGQPHRLYGLDADTGETRWEIELGQEMVHRPVVLPGGAVLATTFAGEILAVGPEDGVVRWRVRDAVANLSPAVANGRLFFRTFGGWLKARRERDGRLLWSVRLQGRVAPPVAVRRGRVWTGDGAGAVVALDGATGQELQRAPLPGHLIGRPIVADGKAAVFVKDAVSGWPRPLVLPSLFPQSTEESHDD